MAPLIRLRRSRRLPGFVDQAPVPAVADPLEAFRFFAVVKTWMDEDIIEATVRNAMVQGVERVFIIDNGSTDDTLSIARAAGAEIAEVYHTEVFDGRLAQSLMNAVVARESLRSGAAHIWWLHLDADEFPEGRHGVSVSHVLAGLDRRVRVVGARFVNHYPDRPPHAVPGFHPGEFQPWCAPMVVQRSHCERHHWKHPLQRFDRHGHFVMSWPGAHGANCSERLAEPPEDIVVRHFRYRDEQRTRDKLDAACGPGSRRTALHESVGYDAFVVRRRSLDAVYGRRWAEVEDLTGTPDWFDSAGLRRWYSVDDLAQVTGDQRGG